MKGRCARCKGLAVNGRHCEDCKAILREEMIQKRKNKDESKFKGTEVYGISKVKKFVDRRFWCTTHGACFRCSLPDKGESLEHIKAKFKRWLYHRKLGRIVFCELILRNGLGKPDLVIVDGGFVWAEEIVVSESDKSIEAKKGKYPFPIQVIKVVKKK